MTDHETHPAGTADLVKHLRGGLVMVSVGLRAADRIEELETALAYVGHASAHRITTLEAALTRANAATAAAYEVAASTIEVIVSDAQKEVGSIKLSKVDAAVVEMLNGIAAAIRALATPDQTAALDKLIAEAVADKDAEISQLNQDLNDMRDNVEIAYYRGYWAGGNGE